MDTSSTVELPPYFGSTCDWYDVPCHASSTLEWVFKFFSWLPQKVFAGLCDALGAIVNAIPVPDFVSSAGTGLAGLSPYIVFFADAFQMGAGLGIVFSAYLIRFGIRRLPFIG